jgi:hypothetical protein
MPLSSLVIALATQELTSIEGFLFSTSSHAHAPKLSRGFPFAPIFSTFLKTISLGLFLAIKDSRRS